MITGDVISYFYILAENEFVFINFYADWCRFSNMLAPIWDEAADKISKEMGSGKIVVGKVDCDKHGKYTNICFLLPQFLETLTP